MPQLDEKQTLLVTAMREAGYHYDDINSSDYQLVFNSEGGSMNFVDFNEVEEWLEGVVFDDPEVSDRVEKTLHPERFRTEVAIESALDDFYDAESGFTHGFRIATVQNDYIVAYDNRIFDTREEAKRAIAENENLVEVTYDDIISKANDEHIRKTMEQLREAEANENVASHGESTEPYYRIFYSYEIDDARKYFAEHEGYHWLFGTEINGGFNGDCYAVYRNVEDLPLVHQEYARGVEKRLEELNTRHYYEPSLGIEGTGEELYSQVVRNYYDNPDPLRKIEEILREEGKDTKADIVGYHREELLEDTSLYSLNRMKIDFALARENNISYGGIDDVTIREDDNSRLALSVMREPSNDTVIISLSEIGDKEDGVGATAIPLDEFLKLNREDFDRRVNELYAYGMERTEREVEREREIVPIAEFSDDERAIYEGANLTYYLAKRNNAINEHGFFFADRSVVYDAVRDFENANDVDFPVISREGSYEDKEFLYSAYDEYVALSHYDELYPKYGKIIEPFAERQQNWLRENGYDVRRKTSDVILSAMAEYYYAEKLGLNSEQMGVLTEFLEYGDESHVSQRAEKMREARNMLLSGLDIDTVRSLKDKDYSTLHTILNGLEYTKTKEQNDILVKAVDDVTAHSITMFFIDVNRNPDLDPNRYNDRAEALIEAFNRFAEGDKNRAWNDKWLADGYGADVWNNLAFPNGEHDDFELTADEIRFMADKAIVDDKFYHPEEIKAIITEERNKQKMAENEKNISHGENKGVGRNKTNAKIEEQKKRVNDLRNIVKSGVESVRNDEEYKAWLRTRSHNFMHKYSFDNIIRVFMQKPDASTVMGYEQWKAYGRQVKAGAKGVDILRPSFYKENAEGNMCRDIMASLSSQLKKNDTATYRVGDTGLVFKASRGSTQITLTVPNGNEMVFRNRQELNAFIQGNIIGKLPHYFEPVKVFDVKDVYAPSFLNMRYGFSENEVVRGKGVGVPIENAEGKVIAKAKYNKDDANAPKGYEWVDKSEIGKGVWELVSAPEGEPIETKKATKNFKAEYLIYNTDERKAKFRDELEMKVVAQNPEVMNTLFESIKELSEEKGVPVKVVSKESEDWQTSKEANGYFHRSEGVVEKAMFPKGYIVIPTELLESDPAHACKTLIHEMAHADLHGEIEKLEKEMGEKVTRAMKETQAESVAFMVAENFGIDSSDYSFKYLATWADSAELADFEKSLNVIDREAKQLVDEISAKLERNGFTRDLQELPKELLSADTVKATVEMYARKIHENSAIIASLNDDVANVAEQSKDDADKADIIIAQKNNIEKRQGEIETQITLLEKFEASQTREEQDDIMCQLEKSFERDSNLSRAFDDLSESLKTIALRNKEGLRVQFLQNGQATLTKMGKDYEAIRNLSTAQKQYIAKSPYVRTALTPLLNTDVGKFVEEVSKRADNAIKVASKTGMFVEVVSCKSMTEPPVLKGGELAHPKVADKIVSEAEMQIRGIKEKSDFFPNADTKMAIYSFTAKNNISCYVAPLRIGDGTQNSLSDYLHKACAEKKELISTFDKAIKERNAKDKIIGIDDISHGEKDVEVVHGNVERVTLEQAKEEIDSRREANAKSDEDKSDKEADKSHEKKPHDRGGKE